MKQILLTIFTALSFLIPLNASMIINEKEYQVDTLIRKEVGPGIVYMRIRIPEFPLNINTLTVDLNNQYNRVETTVGMETLGSTEGLVAAYKRQSVEGKQPIAAANANFWCTTEQPYASYIKGTTFGGNLRNGKILTETNMFSNQWVGGAARSGVVSIDADKKLWIESMSWKGTVKSSKWSNANEIHQVNKMCNVNELVMFNSYYGKTRKFNTTDENTEVFLTINEGQEWAVNKDVKVTVNQIIPNSGGNIIGEYDICLSGNGSSKVILEQLAVGDELDLNYSWSSIKTNDTPFLEQLVAGNAVVLKEGELTERNYDEAYNSRVYSRTGYGMSKDGKTLYSIVIDMSTDSRYGKSDGCSTSVMAEIMKQVGCWNLCSMDAGGSAQMMVQGEVVNKTTEGTPRAVANGWMLYSIAPRSNEIARIEFADYNIKVPVFSSYSPIIYGYNQYGDLIDEEVNGVILTCDKNIGTTDNNVLNAGGNVTSGNITATYNGVSVTQWMNVQDAELALRIKPLLIDNVRKYPIEVTAKIGDIEYNYDPSRLTWTVENPSIASIDDKGILTGIANGSTKISCILGNFSDETIVTVEIPESEQIYQNFNDWTLKGTGGAKELVLSGDGVLSTNYKAERAPNIRMAKNIVFYSLPDKVVLDFTSTLPISYIQVDYRVAKAMSANYVAFGRETGYEANKRYSVELPIGEIGDPADLKIYPISIQSITFYIGTGATTGLNTITFHGLYSEYPQSVGVNDIISDSENMIKIYPNPIEDGMMNVSTSDALNVNIEIFNQSGSKVMQKMISINGGSASVDVSGLTKGMYITRVISENNSYINKIIIK